MKVSERTLNIWAVITLNKEKEFLNPNWIGSLDKMSRIMSVAETEHWNLRVWKEHFFRFSENQRNEIGYIPDADQQLDEAIEDEAD